MKSKRTIPPAMLDYANRFIEALRVYFDTYPNGQVTLTGCGGIKTVIKYKDKK